MRIKAYVSVYLLQISYSRKRELVRGEDYEPYMEEYLNANPSDLTKII